MLNRIQGNGRSIQGASGGRLITYFLVITTAMTLGLVVSIFLRLNGTESMVLALAAGALSGGLLFCVLELYRLGRRSE